jgi:hypothetical protein
MQASLRTPTDDPDQHEAVFRRTNARAREIKHKHRARWLFDLQPSRRSGPRAPDQALIARNISSPLGGNAAPRLQPSDTAWRDVRVAIKGANAAAPATHGEGARRERYPGRVPTPSRRARSRRKRASRKKYRAPHAGLNAGFADGDTMRTCEFAARAGLFCPSFQAIETELPGQFVDHDDLDQRARQNYFKRRTDRGEIVQKYFCC